ncbi:MAG TPA: DUF3052 family protein [Anaerolineae bacterium]|nr:DUF3052 family protein [Anaerolineae bacterium]
MHRVRLIHWNATEAEERAELIGDFGYEVVYKLLDATELRRMKETPPSAVVIDLSRLPSQGRDLGISLRKFKTTRHVPLVFVGGDPEKVARIKEILPDVIYTTWDKLGDSLEHAIANPQEDPIVPESVFEAYAGASLPKKLGFKADSVVALHGAPEGFEKTFGELPKGVVIRRQVRGGRDMTLWFPKSQKDLEGQIEMMTDFAEEGGLWIVWPKKSSGISSDLSQTIVRNAGLGAGIVDFKICAIDKTWSGLRFTKRKENTDNSKG